MTGKLIIERKVTNGKLWAHLPGAKNAAFLNEIHTYMTIKLPTHSQDGAINQDIEILSCFCAIRRYEN